MTPSRSCPKRARSSTSSGPRRGWSGSRRARRRVRGRDDGCAVRGRGTRGPGGAAARSGRAALDLVGAVVALGQEVGAPDLRARAGVLTGEASVTIGAEGQGMVAGDLVNTASRIQSAAPPGAVFVGDVTRRATEAAIAYEDAGTHELKGKAEPVPLWRAVRVVASVGGSIR